MKRSLLFVTHQDDNFDDGLSYALDLAQMTDKGMAILLVNKEKFSERFDSIMSAVAFAEANEHDAARQFLGEDNNGNGGYIPEALEEKCRKSGIAARVYTTLKDTVSGLRDFLTQHGSVDMVLLAPNVTEGGISSRELNRLIKTASRPVVTMTRHTVER